MSNGRACAGGEVGLNGDFYKGGTFLPSTHKPKGLPGRKRKAPRRALIAPGELGPVPVGMTSIYQRIQHFTRVVGGQAIAVFADDHPSMTYYFSGPEELHALIQAFNLGERFV